MKMLKFVLLFGLSLPLAAADKRLASVRTIRIGTISEIGVGESVEFVTVVDAAAILGMSAWSTWPGAWVMSLAVLKTPDGENIWEKEFQNRGTVSGAQSIAKKLRTDVALAAR